MDEVGAQVVGRAALNIAARQNADQAGDIPVAGLFAARVGKCDLGACKIYDLLVIRRRAVVDDSAIVDLPLLLGLDPAHECCCILGLGVCYADPAGFDVALDDG